jgi:diguanylate cyclase (GGDEF)-like protein/PAS domain S-box-containing protein
MVKLASSNNKNILMPFSRLHPFFIALSWGFFSLATAPLVFASESQETSSELNTPYTQTMDEDGSSWLLNPNNFDIELNYDSYSVAEGLSQSIVTSIVEDNEGFVWIGTLNGLNRFDGTDFKHFFADNNSGLPSSFIRSLLIDQQGRLLVGTDSGLAVYDNSKESFKAWTNQGVSLTEPVWALDKSEDHVFIGLNKKVLILKNDNITSFSSDEFKEITEMKFNDNILFIRNYEGDILKIENKKVEKIFSSSIDIASFSGELFITSNEGLYTYKSGKLKKRSDEKHSLIVTIDDELISRVGDRLLLTNKNKIDHNIGVIPNKNNSHTNSVITASKNNIFITFMNKGFIKINRKQNISIKPSEIKDNTWSMTNDAKYIYIASDSSTIKIYTHELEYEKELITNAAYGAKYIAIINNDFFVGSATGLIKIDLISGNSLTLSDENISHLSVNDNTLIVASDKGDVMLINENSEVIEQFKLESNYPIYDILIDNKRIWIASQNGLTLRENKVLTKVIDNEFVTSIKLFNDVILFGTRTTLYSIDTNNLNIVEIYSHNKIIYSIITDGSKIITSSNGEICITDYKTKKTTTLNSRHGIQADYNLLSSLNISDNWIFGGTDGLSIIRNDFHDIISRHAKPKTMIASFSVFNTIQSTENLLIKKPINLLKEITLKFTDYPFSFKFIVPGKALDEVDFFYQMQGLSDDWLPAKEVNSATYTNLSHSEYFFNVYAIDKLTGQQGPTKSIKVIITPPWWFSLEAKLVYALLTLLFIASITRAYLRRRAVQKQIALSEERLKLSLWGSGDEMWDWDIQSGNIYRSNIWGILDFPQDGQRTGELGSESNIHPQDQARVQAALEAHFKGETNHFEITYRVKDRNNNWLWILDRAKIVERDNNERPLRMTGTIKDINSIKQTEEQLRLFARAIENISEGMFILDESYQFVEVNSACCELLLQEKSTFQGEILSFSLYPESFSAQIRQLIKQQGYWSGDIEAAKADNSQFLMSLAIDSIKNEQGEISHYVGIFSDITRRKQQEEELRKLTNNDILTGLPNRSSLQVTLSNLVKKDTHHTLMVLDLDNFKRINDSLGHQVGDDLLIQVAKRIETTIPAQASLYRLGGDEFAILLDNNPDIGSSAAIATNVIEALKRAFEVQDENLVIGLSIGIVLYPEDEQNEQALLRKADIAMYHAKSGGGNRYQFYSESLNQNVLRQLEVENLIREGLRDDLFEVHYQAKVNLKLNRVTGMEALVRLNHPVHGLIPPNDFIPLAEENGLIIEIGDIVLRKACTAAQKWREQGIFNGRIAVNLSSKQFALPDLVQRIESILRLTQLPAENLELEITEGTVIKNPESAIKVMQQLTKMGISLALDDFGTGYSSLSYLKRFPIHRLKVDKSFVDDIDKSDMDLKMVDSIITIAHNMGLTVVGEGVEQASQLAILRALNCEEIQGYIFSRPVPEAEFTELLNLDASKDIQQAASDIESINEFIKMKKINLKKHP